MWAWKTTWRPLPPALALYMAISALRSSSSVVSSGRENVTPMLVATRASVPSSSRGSAKDSVIVTATRSTSAGSVIAFEQDGELVAAEARHGVGGPGALHEALGRGLQQAVAGVVPERVVHVLEVVQVQEHHRDLLA